MAEDTSDQDTVENLDSTKPTEARAPLPQRIGPYRILQKLGEGGMGIVYEAEQEEPIRRRVALKVIKAGMDTAQVIARFEAERQALAMMDHPNVAKVYDAGSTEGDRPYFSMEYVMGVPITEFCDRHRLTTEKRLELFIQVCEGIQHAHQSAIIHRDIKPSNVLVTTHGEKRLVKIIDFGVAKATAQRLTERTLFTELGQLIGTPEYMSPEQAEMTPESVDTRTDVYSLGVLLYELLAGALPFDSRELRRAGFDEIRRKIREDVPPKPSTRISKLGDTSTDSAKKRRTDPASLVRLLRGDLDWITMKALEKERTRRYGSPNEFLADISRHLRHEPVVASPPSTVYRAAKFVRRHRVGAAAVSIAVIVLVVGVSMLTATTLQMIRAQAAEIRAKEETLTSESALGYLVDFFGQADLDQSGGESPTLREILDGQSNIPNALPEQPGARARVMVAMGQIHSRLGMYQEAVSLLEQALPLLQSSYGDESKYVVGVLNQIGILYTKMQDFQRAIQQFEQLLAIEVALSGEESDDSLNIRKNLADAYARSGRPDDARKMLDFVLEVRKRTLGSDSMKIAKVLNSMAGTMAKSGKYEAAISYAEQSLEIRLNQSEQKPASVGFGYFTLADVHLQSSAYEEALDNFTKAMSAWEEVYDADHDRISIVLSRLAETHKELGNHKEGYAFYQRTRAIDEKNLDPDNPDSARVLAESMDDFAELLDGLGHPDEAEGARSRAAELRKQHGLSRARDADED